MKGKEVGALIALIVMIPTLVGLIIWSIALSNDPADKGNIEKGAELIADSAIPWWLGIFSWLAGLPGIIGAISIIGFVYFLKWIGEIK